MRQSPIMQSAIYSSDKVVTQVLIFFCRIWADKNVIRRNIRALGNKNRILYLIITSAPAGGNIERIHLCVVTLVKSHLERIVAPWISSISQKKWNDEKRGNIRWSLYFIVCGKNKNQIKSKNWGGIYIVNDLPVHQNSIDACLRENFVLHW